MLQNGRNFTNIQSFIKCGPRYLGSISPTYLRTAFTFVDPKSVKRYWRLDWILMLLGTTGIKAAHKHVDEIEPSWSLRLLFLRPTKKFNCYKQLLRGRPIPINLGSFLTLKQQGFRCFQTARNRNVFKINVCEREGERERKSHTEKWPVVSAVCPLC